MRCWNYDEGCCDGETPTHARGGSRTVVNIIRQKFLNLLRIRPSRKAGSEEWSEPSSGQDSTWKSNLDEERRWQECAIPVNTGTSGLAKSSRIRQKSFGDNLTLSFHDCYSVGSVIGHGTFGLVDDQ